MSTHKAVLTAQRPQRFQIVFPQQGMRISSHQNEKHSHAHKNMGYERSQIVSKRSNADKSGLWAISNFLLSDQTFIASFVSDQRFSYVQSKTSFWVLIEGSDFPIIFDMQWVSCFPISSIIWGSVHDRIFTFLPEHSREHPQGCFDDSGGANVFKLSSTNKNENLLRFNFTPQRNGKIFEHSQKYTLWAFRKYVWAIKADNQLCERSEFPLWVIKDVLMITHAPVLSTHRGFFCPISFIMP